MIYFMLVMMSHVEVIMQPIGKLIRYYKLDIIGQPYIDMPNDILHNVMNAKEW